MTDLHFEWLKHGRPLKVDVEPGAWDLRHVGGRLAYDHYSVRLDPNACLLPWIVEWRGAVGTQAVSEQWFYAQCFGSFREARSAARRLTRAAIRRRRT